MKFVQRLYVPFNSYKERIELDPGHRIAYYARSFDWVDVDTDLELALDHGKVKDIFDEIEEISQTAECERRKMGCIITDERLIVYGRGANVKPEGLKGDCRAIGCIPAVTCRLTIHAEISALNNLHKHFLSWKPENLFLFNTAVPCLDCMKFCRANDIRVIIYKEERDQPEYDRPIMSSITLNSGILFVKVIP
jgi:deoxycytidylate deaminase